MASKGPPTPREWLARWDQQQEIYLPQREARFRAMFDAVDATVGDRFVAIDLACGPGSLTERLLTRFPTSRVIAVDHDPVLLDLGRAALEPLSRRIAWIDADLKRPEWTERLPVQTVDAILSTTALHWLDEATLRRLYRDLAKLLRPGGIFLNGDHLAYAPEEAALTELSTTARHRREAEERHRPGAEDWEEWWTHLRAAGGRERLFQERDRRFPGVHGEEPGASLAGHTAALRDAGFPTVGVIWQTFDNRVIAALR